MAEPRISTAEARLQAIRHTVVLAAWIEDARQTLARLEEIRDFYPDISKRLAELGCVSPIAWQQEESAALVGVMQAAEWACREQSGS